MMDLLTQAEKTVSDGVTYLPAESNVRVLGVESVDGQLQGLRPSSLGIFIFKSDLLRKALKCITSVGEGLCPGSLSNRGLLFIKRTSG